MSIMNTTWTFYDGIQKHPYAPFPYAFRSMFNSIKRGVESGKKYEDMIKIFKIYSPTGISYSHTKATDLATQQGLLTSDGLINSREFKRK